MRMKLSSGYFAFLLQCKHLHLNSVVPKSDTVKEIKRILPTPSYEGPHIEMRGSPPYAETRNPCPYSEDGSPWLESTNWEVDVPSGSPYQTEEQEEDEKVCLCSCSWKVPFKFQYFFPFLSKYQFHLLLFFLLSCFLRPKRTVLK